MAKRGRRSKDSGRSRRKLKEQLISRVIIVIHIVLHVFVGGVRVGGKGKDVSQLGDGFEHSGEIVGRQGEKERVWDEGEEE